MNTVEEKKQTPQASQPPENPTSTPATPVVANLAEDDVARVHRRAKRCQDRSIRVHCEGNQLQLYGMTCPTDGGREASLLHRTTVNTKGPCCGREGYTTETSLRRVQAPGRQTYRRGRHHLSPTLPLTRNQYPDTEPLPHSYHVGRTLQHAGPLKVAPATSRRPPKERSQIQRNR